MVVSLFSLTAFQVFWLKNVYDEEKRILQKKTDDIFQKTVTSMQDSLFQKQIDNLLDLKRILPLVIKSENKALAAKVIPTKNLPTNQKATKIVIGSGSDMILINKAVGGLLKNSDLPFDSVSSGLNKNIVSISIRKSPKVSSKLWPRKYNDSLQATLAPIDFDKSKEKDTVLFKLLDSLMRYEKSKTKTNKANPVSVSFTNLDENFKLKKIFNSAPKPKELKVKGPLNNTSIKVSIKKSAKGGNDTLIQFPTINLTNDSLKISKISQKYADSLRKSGIVLPFIVKRLPQKTKIFSTKSLNTSQVYAGVPYDFGYMAQFDNYRRFVFKKIIAHAGFSLLLIGLTALAFGLVFRNLSQQRRLTELKNDFIGNVTHELKTPITTVSVALEALQSFDMLKKPDKAKEYLDISQNELARLSVLVDKVLKMSVFEQQGITLELEDIDLKILVKQVIDTLRLQFEKYNASIDFKFLGNDFSLRADRTHLTNVVYNLLDNALKYSNKSPKITIEITENEKNINLIIADDGIGIEPVYQGKVFEKFFRVPTGDTHDVKGYGLGLSYVASVVQQHGGEVKLDSVLEKGSRFMITLPKII